MKENNNSKDRKRKCTKTNSNRVHTIFLQIQPKHAMAEAMIHNKTENLLRKDSMNQFKLRAQMI